MLWDLLMEDAVQLQSWWLFLLLRWGLEIISPSYHLRFQWQHLEHLYELPEQKLSIYIPENQHVPVSTVLIVKFIKERWARGRSVLPWHCDLLLLPVLFGAQLQSWARSQVYSTPHGAGFVCGSEHGLSVHNHIDPYRITCTIFLYQLWLAQTPPAAREYVCILHSFIQLFGLTTFLQKKVVVVGEKGTWIRMSCLEKIFKPITVFALQKVLIVGGELCFLFKGI